MDIIVSRFNACLAGVVVCLLLLSAPSWSNDGFEVQYAYWRSADPVLLKDVRNVNESHWNKVEHLASYGFDDAEYWVRINIHNATVDSVNRIFRFVHPV